MNIHKNNVCVFGLQQCLCGWYMSKIQMDEGAKVSQHNVGLDPNDQCHSPHMSVV